MAHNISMVYKDFFWQFARRISDRLSAHEQVICYE